MYFPATYSFFPVWNVGRVIVTMHDTLALAHPNLVFPAWQGRVAWRLKEHLAARCADLIMTVSETARRDLLAWFRLSEHRVRVMTEGPDPVFSPRPLGPYSDSVLARYGVDPHNRFLLYVGGLSPHKNLPRLIDAFARSGLSRDGTSLVLVGDMGDVFHTHVPALREVVARTGMGERVVFTGFVPDDNLAYLYSRTDALVQPSLMEGFGLPPVEAMACGKPVVSSTAGSLPEVVGDAGLYFEPTDVAAMAGALRRIVDDPGLRVTLATRASERARRYTWEAAAATLLDAFEELAGSKRPAVAATPRVREWRRSA
jgi:glycosyltransferase involved in cell wall biosynthesis